MPARRETVIGNGMALIVATVIMRIMRHNAQSHRNHEIQTPQAIAGFLFCAIRRKICRRPPQRPLINSQASPGHSRTLRDREGKKERIASVRQTYQGNQRPRATGTWAAPFTAFTRRKKEARNPSGPREPPKRAAKQNYSFLSLRPASSRASNTTSIAAR